MFDLRPLELPFWGSCLRILNIFTSICSYLCTFGVVFFFFWCQRAAVHCTDPSPCLRPPCTREVWVLTAALLMACRPIVTASPATPILSWAPQHPATIWTLSATGSPPRSVQQALPQYATSIFSRIGSVNIFQASSSSSHCSEHVIVLDWN